MTGMISKAKLYKSTCVCFCAFCEHSKSEAETGYLQALDSGGTPLCLSCQKPSVEHSGWAGGFCSASCMEELQLRSSRDYARSRVLETEQGVCQSCGLDARQLYLRVRDAPHTHRKEILDNTWLAQLPLKQVSLKHFGLWSWTAFGLHSYPLGR